MLAQKLLGATASAPKVPPVFVGAQFYSGASPAVSRICNFDNLTGGIASTPSIGDLIIVAAALNSSADRNISLGSAGQFIKVADLYANGTNDAQLGVGFRIATANGGGTEVSWNASSPYIICAYVWRGVSAANPLDATTTTATNTSSGTADSPSITTVTKESVVLSIGASAGAFSTYNAFTVPSGMTNFAQSLDAITGTSTSPKVQLGLASRERPTAGAYNPPAFGGGFSTTSSTSCSATLALRPA
jgi:hypothetical protein